MRKFKQNKLWRDKGVNMMEQNHGSHIHWKRLGDIEYDQQLRIKFIEEAKEVQDAQSRNELIEELADILEVIDALCALHAVSKDDVTAVQEKKKQKRGGFFERKFVTIAEHPEGSFGVKYCLADPDKYPEVFSE